MSLGNRMQQNELIVVKIEQVDLANRIAHVRDKTNSPLLVAFREAPAGVMQVPAQDQKWTAKRVGATWRLEHKLDSLTEHLWAVENMSDGDTRISGESVFINATDIVFNGQPVGGTALAVFDVDGATSAITLPGSPVSDHTVQVFVNGLLLDPRSYSVSNRSIAFTVDPPAGVLVVYFQQSAQVYTDFAMVVGHSVVSGTDLYP